MLTYDQIRDTYMEVLGDYNPQIKIVCGIKDLKKMFGEQSVKTKKGMFENSCILINPILYNPGEQLTLYNTFLKNLGNAEKAAKEVYPESIEELREILNATKDTTISKQTDVFELVSRGSNSPSTQQALASLYEEKLTDQEKVATVVYKTRIFSVMNNLWSRFESTEKIDFNKVQKELETGRTSFCKEISSIMSFFNKAQQNPENSEFFDKYLSNIDFSTSQGFVSSVISQMKIIEEIQDKITAPQNLILFRGVYGTSSPQNISASRFASTTPDYRTANNFAVQYSNGFTSIGNNTLFRMRIHEGTPIIPLLFSVKTSIKGIDAEMPTGIDYDSLPNDAINITLDTQNIQPEILLDTNICKVSLDEKASPITITQKRVGFTIPSDDLFAPRIYEPGFAPVISAEDGYSSTFYPQVEVTQDLEKIKTTQKLDSQANNETSTNQSLISSSTTHQHCSESENKTTLVQNNTIPVGENCEQ